MGKIGKKGQGKSMPVACRQVAEWVLDMFCNFKWTITKLLITQPLKVEKKTSTCLESLELKKLMYF